MAQRKRRTVPRHGPRTGRGRIRRRPGPPRAKNGAAIRWRIAIVGRPNVGKSTLFNRLAGRRQAITDATPGVTRDPIAAPSRYDGRLLLIDTGGVAGAAEGLDRIVSDRAIESVRSADLTLFVVSVEEITGDDQALAETLRPFADRTVLVVNKVDTEDREAAVAGFAELGFPRIVAVSAAHGAGVRTLQDTIAAELSRLAPDGAARPATAPGEATLPEDATAAERTTATDRESAGIDAESVDSGDATDHAGPDTDATADAANVRLAIVGRPNTGKSTLMNRLVGAERSIVSDIPGTTRDVVEASFAYRDTEIHLADTAGLRRRSRVNEPVEYYSTTRAVDAIESSDVAILLVDAAEGLTDQDKKIAAVSVKRRTGVVIGLNKWDKFEQVPNRLQAMTDRIRFQFPVLGYAPVVALSAANGEGVDDLLDAVVKVARQRLMRIDTPALNKSLATWTKAYAPSRKGREIKIRYGTQLPGPGPAFVFFAGGPRGMDGEYRSYLANRIRESYGFSAVPVQVEIRRQAAGRRS